MDTGCASTTVSVAVAEILLAVSVAVMVTVFIVGVEPLRSAVARPYVPKLFPIVTAASSDELQAAAVVQSIAVPFENTAVAVNCCVVPAVMVELAGAIVIDSNVPPREQLVKFIAAAKSAIATNPLYFKPVINALLPAYSFIFRSSILQRDIVSESDFIINRNKNSSWLFGHGCVGFLRFTAVL